MEDAAPISDSVTDPEQQSEIVTAQDQANAVDLTAPDAKEQLETLGQQLSQNQATVMLSHKVCKLRVLIT